MLKVFRMYSTTIFHTMWRVISTGLVVRDAQVIKGWPLHWQTRRISQKYSVLNLKFIIRLKNFVTRTLMARLNSRK
ncbi:hypothetical protein D3C76_1062640 [compost metagenome]